MLALACGAGVGPAVGRLGDVAMSVPALKARLLAGETKSNGTAVERLYDKLAEWRDHPTIANARVAYVTLKVAEGNSK